MIAVISYQILGFKMDQQVLKVYVYKSVHVFNGHDTPLDTVKMRKK